MAQDRVIVFVAIRMHGGRVGYFSSLEEVPADWRLSYSPRRDISDVMLANQCTKEQALMLLNQNWRPWYLACG